MSSRSSFTLWVASINILLLMWSCNSSRIVSNAGSAYYSPIDNSTLYADKAPYNMPYNRIIDAAGETVRYGDGNLENHSLDAIVLQDGKTLAVQDRYGLALFDLSTRKILERWTYSQETIFAGSMSTYSGITTVQYHDSTFIFWGAGGREIESANGKVNSYVMQAYWNPRATKKIKLIHAFPFKPESPATIALPNQVITNIEGGQLYLYTVLNGNNKVIKVNVNNQEIIWSSPTGVAPYGLVIASDKLYVTNWAGSVPDPSDGKETAGVPWGSAYVDPKTGAIEQGTVSVFDPQTGRLIREIKVGLHPNSIVRSPDGLIVYVANSNSDYISVIDVERDKAVDSIFVGLFNDHKEYVGSSPNGLAIHPKGNLLYVANGLDNAICVIDLKSRALNQTYSINGYIPTEAYPSSVVLHEDDIIVTNLEANGARAIQAATESEINTKQRLKNQAARDAKFNAHRQHASISFIPVPDTILLKSYTEKVRRLNMEYRLELVGRLPRPDALPKPVPERIGEPSVFKHVLYIIKENRTYDQVLGDMPEGRGMKALCLFGDSVTPNQHQLARDYVLMDNYHVSGKGSAEGHHWASAGMVTDYTEKMVRAWFRSYPHVLNDAMAYNKNGLIWNNALDHGKSVRIYGEACTFEYDKNKYNWKTLYNLWQQKKLNEFKGVSTTTISRVRPILAQTFPGGDDETINEQMRADAFIKELNEFESMPGDQLPQLMIMALPNDHTAGTSPNFPTPRAMVADNDLAVGRIVEAIMHSRFAENTVIFISEDDSQAGWDHISAYRTTGFVISAYSRLKKTIHTNYNQTSMLRTIEQILGLPPMNVIDATALPMFDCFSDRPNLSFKYKTIKNKIALDEMNPERQNLQGAAQKFSDQSVKYAVHLIDRGHDAILNRILWHSVKGNKPYPAHLAGGDDADD